MGKHVGWRGHQAVCAVIGEVLDALHTWLQASVRHVVREDARQGVCSDRQLCNPGQGKGFPPHIVRANAEAVVRARAHVALMPPAAIMLSSLNDC